MPKNKLLRVEHIYNPEQSDVWYGTNVYGDPSASIFKR
jgi:hypothetical protein